METLILVDGSSFLYRAYHVSKGNFTTSKGVPTGVSLIITRMLRNLIHKFSDSKIIVVFDAKGKSFRADLYSLYKANRPPMPDDLKAQIEYVHRIVKALGLPLISVPHVEADDVLGSYAKFAKKQNMKVIICTGDKDLAQLVDDDITLYDAMNDKFIDRTAVTEKFGVPPELIIDYLALKGDSSDNIPGMKGCGDKSAIALLNGIGGIDTIFSNLDKIKNLDFRGAKTFASKFSAEKGNIKLSYELATIKTDLPLQLDLQKITPPVCNYIELKNIFKELEFYKLAQELDEQYKDKDTLSEHSFLIEEKNKSQDFLDEKVSDFSASSFHTILNLEDLDSLISEIKNCGFVSIDTETNSLKPSEALIVGISFAIEPFNAYYLPLNHSYLGAPKQISLGLAKQKLNTLFSDESIKFIGQNLKYDKLVLFFNGFEVPKVYADTMLLAYILDTHQKVGMDELCQKYLNYKTIKYDDVTLQGRKHLSFEQVDIEVATKYAAEDAEGTLRLYQVLSKKVEGIPVLNDLMNKVDLPFLHVLYEMEKTGTLLDPKVLSEQNRLLNVELSELQSQIFLSANEQFNISSPKQLGTVLFDHLQIPYPKKLKVGKSYSTAEDVLQEIAVKYDIANLILRYREISKLISTYTDKLPTMISDKTGRIHSSFYQTGTITGRLSSNDPNLQNIPARTSEGKLIRKAFIAPKGYTLVSADYSQIELRLIAHISGDEALCKAFNQGKDIHKATAAEVLGKHIDEITPQERSYAKSTNFGLMYGMGAFGLSRQTGMSVTDARSYIEKYFSRYPKIRDYMDLTKHFAQSHGYVETLFGRRISVYEINSTNAIAKRGAERAAINAPMQGSAADIIKKAMINIQAWIDSLPENTVRMTLQVHDELIFEVKNEFVEEAEKNIKKLMESVVKLKVPLTVGIGKSDNWGDAH